MEPGHRPTSGDDPAASVDVAYAPADEPRFATIVYLRGEHDLATTPQVVDAISEISGSVLVDLSDCDFIDSTVIGALFDYARSINESGSTLEIVAPPGRECRAHARDRPDAHARPGASCPSDYRPEAIDRRIVATSLTP